MITREQVADLREGDVVELGFSSGTVIRGRLVEDRHGNELRIADAGWTVRDDDGAMGYGLERYAETLTVISRAPRPLYVNHPRTEPVAGDVVRDADSPLAGDNRVWLCDPAGDWWTAAEDTVRMAGSPTFEVKFPKRLWLLVDGETGRVVTS